MTDYVRLDTADNVVTVTRPLEAGAAIENCSTLSMVPRGHKVATSPIAAGEPIRKYAQIIGYAGEDIAPGTHLHTHNILFKKNHMLLQSRVMYKNVSGPLSVCL